MSTTAPLVVRVLLRSAFVLMIVAGTALSAGQNIAPTSATAGRGPAPVIGQPRLCQGHPCTLWDKQDVARLRELLKTSPVLQQEFTRLKAEMDRRLAQPLGVPGPGADAPTREGYRAHGANARDMSDLGTVYALSGDVRYGDYCRKMLLAYADGYPTYKHPDGWTLRRYRSAQDGRLTGQFLEDGAWLIQAARGYDLVYDLPSWTPAERARVRDDLFQAIANEFVDDVLGKDDYLGQTHNRSVICNCGVLMAGYASDDARLINLGLYGKGGTKEKPTGGVFGVHFGPQAIDVDGLWNEGAIGYHFMALGALDDDAEMLWRHGVDMYSYRNGAFKGLFDSPLQFVYPDLTAPSTHDSGRISLLTDWFTDCPQCYEYGYLRYGDERYLAIINPSKPHLRLSLHQGPTSALFERRPEEKPALPCESVNFSGVGYGVQRLQTADGVASLLLEYGPSRSHGHPSKLGIDLYALGDVLAPDPGVIFPYNAPLDASWYWTTPAHNTLTVDEKPQIYGGNRWKFPRNLPEPDAQQVIYIPAASLALQRVTSDSVYPGVAQDRAVFFTGQYLADLFSASSTSKHTYDLAWHIRGTLTTELPLTPMQFPEPVQPGYIAMTDVRHAQASAAVFSAAIAGDHHTARLLAATAEPTEIIVANGYYHTLHGEEKTPLVLQRRNAASTVFATVLDFSGTPGGHVKSISLEGGCDAGYSLLKIETVAGADLCLAAYRPGAHRAAGMETDAQQAMTRQRGSQIQAMCLAGGTFLKCAGAELARSAPGLAYIEIDKAGHYVIGNPGPADAVVTATLPALAGSRALIVDGGAKPAELARASANGSLVLPMKAGMKVQCVAGGQ